ncbi:MAG: hypothetical protein ABJ215_09250 [Alphaproteobacteria bacterium]
MSILSYAIIAPALIRINRKNDPPRCGFHEQDHPSNVVMPARVAAIHVIGSRDITTWMAGSSPAMAVFV